MQTFVSPITIPLAEDLDLRVNVDQGRRGRITVGELIVSFLSVSFRSSLASLYIENIVRMLKITTINQNCIVPRVIWLISI